MELGLRWDWETFPQWMDSLAGHPLWVNVGALVPFNPLRLYVVGVEEARDRVNATDSEINQMKAIVHDAMKAGAFGWSSMKTLLNRPDDGRFIPSQVACNEEYLALAEVYVLSLALGTSAGREAPPSVPCLPESPIYWEVIVVWLAPAYRWTR